MASYSNYQHLIEAEITAEIDRGYQLKVSILDLGLYISGWRIIRPKGNKDWWLQPPAYPIKGRWWKNVEFDTKKPLWLEIEAKCLEAVKLYEASASPSDEDLTDESIAEAFDEATKSWGLEDSESGKAVSWKND